MPLSSYDIPSSPEMQSISTSISLRDSNVLMKIKDPEWNPSATITMDNTLPKDPNMPDLVVYSHIVKSEREIIQSLQQLEIRLARAEPTLRVELVQEYRRCVLGFASLIGQYPMYASARNNRAQGYRRLYGNSLFLCGGHGPGALLSEADALDPKVTIAHVVLSDLDEAIKLLSPKMPHTSISPQAGRTLSSAHTQRAAIYHTIAKSFETRELACITGRRESCWTKADFEEAASRDFAQGARYGNEIAKGLAVSTNPTAKLCGQMVAAAMKEEYGPSYSCESRKFL
ncbi:hypothetical protein GGR53DRAFT_504616 [Hypoxylon sp. FL1150]|nr:hypothetical protein GGR53DRAFT_504616 [Hypoxylon sp. FL1150]